MSQSFAPAGTSFLFLFRRRKKMIFSIDFLLCDRVIAYFCVFGNFISGRQRRMTVVMIRSLLHLVCNNPLLFFGSTNKNQSQMCLTYLSRRGLLFWLGGIDAPVIIHDQVDHSLKLTDRCVFQEWSYNLMLKVHKCVSFAGNVILNIHFFGCAQTGWPKLN